MNRDCFASKRNPTRKKLADQGKRRLTFFAIIFFGIFNFKARTAKEKKLEEKRKICWDLLPVRRNPGWCDQRLLPRKVYAQQYWRPEYRWNGSTHRHGKTDLCYILVQEPYVTAYDMSNEVFHATHLSFSKLRFGGGQAFLRIGNLFFFCFPTIFSGCCLSVT